MLYSLYIFFYLIAMTFFYSLLQGILHSILGSGNRRRSFYGGISHMLIYWELWSLAFMFIVVLILIPIIIICYFKTIHTTNTCCTVDTFFTCLLCLSLLAMIWFFKQVLADDEYNKSIVFFNDWLQPVIFNYKIYYFIITVLILLNFLFYDSIFIIITPIT